MPGRRQVLTNGSGSTLILASNWDLHRVGLFSFSLEWLGWQASGHFPFLWVRWFRTGSEQVRISVCRGLSFFSLAALLLHVVSWRPWTPASFFISLAPRHQATPLLSNSCKCSQCLKKRYIQFARFDKDQNETLLQYVLLHMPCFSQWTHASAHVWRGLCH